MFKEYNAKAYELSKQALILDVGKIYVSVHDGVDRECENVISIFLSFLGLLCSLCGYALLLKVLLVFLVFFMFKHFISFGPVKRWVGLLIGLLWQGSKGRQPLGLRLAPVDFETSRPLLSHKLLVYLACRLLDIPMEGCRSHG